MYVRKRQPATRQGTARQDRANVANRDAHPRHSSDRVQQFRSNDSERNKSTLPPYFSYYSSQATAIVRKTYILRTVVLQPRANLEIALCYEEEDQGALPRLDLSPQEVVQEAFSVPFHSVLSGERDKGGTAVE